MAGSGGVSGGLEAGGLLRVAGGGSREEGCLQKRYLIGVIDWESRGESGLWSQAGGTANYKVRCNGSNFSRFTCSSPIHCSLPFLYERNGSGPSFL